MRITGHKTRSVFERYKIVSDGDLTDAARKLNLALTGTKVGQSGTTGGITTDQAQDITAAQSAS